MSEEGEGHDRGPESANSGPDQLAQVVVSPPEAAEQEGLLGRKDSLDGEEEQKPKEEGKMRSSRSFIGAMRKTMAELKEDDDEETAPVAVGLSCLVGAAPFPEESNEAGKPEIQTEDSTAEELHKLKLKVDAAASQIDMSQALEVVDPSMSSQALEEKHFGKGVEENGSDHSEDDGIESPEPTQGKQFSKWTSARKVRHSIGMQMKAERFLGLTRSSAAERERQEQEARYQISLAALKEAAKNMVSKELQMFRDLLKEKGQGNLTAGWRRYFDSDGDGVLTFIEFCDALSQLSYGGDVLALWGEIDADQSNRISLDEIDPDGYLLLSVFKSWCFDNFGGPIEMFEIIDDDGSESLTKDEFQQGIKKLGWFEQEGLPDTLDTEEEVMDALWPMLDADGMGVVTPEEFLFMEPDKEKRTKLEKDMHRKKMERERGGRQGFAGGPRARSVASKLLHEVARSNTQVGGKHWKMIPGASHSGSSLIYKAPAAPDAEVVAAQSGTSAPVKVEPTPPPWLVAMATEMQRAQAASKTEAERIEWRKSERDLEKLWRSERKLQFSCPALPPIEKVVDPRGILWEAGSLPSTPSTPVNFDPAQNALETRTSSKRNSVGLPQIHMRSNVPSGAMNGDADEARRQERHNRRQRELQKKAQRRNIYKGQQLPAVVHRGGSMPLLGVRPNARLKRSGSGLMGCKDFLAPGATLDLFQHYYLK